MTDIATARWYVSQLSISDGTEVLAGTAFHNCYVCKAETPELAEQIVADHNAALNSAGPQQLTAENKPRLRERVLLFRGKDSCTWEFGFVEEQHIGDPHYAYTHWMPEPARPSMLARATADALGCEIARVPQ